MAQETGIFSVRRPRETLGAVNNNISAIPMPSSAMKRSSSIGNMHQPGGFAPNHARSTSGSRMSLAPRPNQPNFQRSSSGNDLGFQSVQRNSMGNVFNTNSTGRKSFAPGSIFQTPAAPAPALDLSTQRRSSVFKTRASAGSGSLQKQSFFTTAPVPSGVPTDPRRLKDASTKQQMAAELMEYLTRNNFEMEAGHVLSNKSMTSPTQKDFNMMFQWLYKRIDPNYRFQKNIDQELPPLLKQLRYPFEKSISKSQISAVGGSNWWMFLGLLHWMMQLAVMMEAYETGRYDEACEEAGYDVTADRIIFDFLTSAYSTFMSAEDDEEGDEDEVRAKIVKPHVDAMAARFDQANAQHLEQVKILEAEHQNLKDRVDEHAKANDRITELEKQIKILEEDQIKFEAYNNQMDAKVKKYSDRCTLFEDNIKEVEAELEAFERERQELQDIIDGRGITISDIDRMSSERERLEKSLETATARLEESKKRVAEKELAASRKLDELEQVVEKYNSQGYQIGIIPSTAINANGQDYELVITVGDAPNFSGSQMAASAQDAGDRLLADGGAGYLPQHLLNLDLRGTVKNNILSMRKKIAERRNKALEDDMKNHELLDNAKEALEDKQAEVEAMGHKVQQAEEELEKLREITGTQKTASDAQIEKMEKELSRMRANLGESVQVMEQREMAVNIEYEQLTLRVNQMREELHTEIERMLTDIVQFKLHIQKSLEEYEELVADEIERSGEEEDRMGDVEGEMES